MNKNICFKRKQSTKFQSNVLVKLIHSYCKKSKASR